MKKTSVVYPFIAAIVAVAALTGLLVTGLLDRPLGQTVRRLVEVPLILAVNEIHRFSAESFQDLLDNRMEEDPDEVRDVQIEVLSRIRHFRPAGESFDPHMVVIDREGNVIAESKLTFGEGRSVAHDEVGGDGSDPVTLTRPDGTSIIGFHRFFPAWGWHLFAMVPEETINSKIRGVKMFVHLSLAIGFAVLLLLFLLLARIFVQKPLAALESRANELRHGEGAGKTIRSRGPGEIGRLAGAFEEMAEAIRDREILLSAQAKIPETSPNLVVKLSPEGKVLFANRTARERARELGLAADRCDLLLPGNALSLLAEVSGKHDTRRTFTHNLGGQVLSFGVFGFDDEPAVIFNGTDVTDERSVQAQLVQAQKMEVLGRIAGGVAHDFNNLLAGIMGHASLVGSLPGLPASVTRSMESIMAASGRGAQMTRQLLGFARKGTHERLPLDVNTVVEETVGILSQAFPKNIIVRIRKALDLPTIDGDATSIHQGLMNLCINAKDAMPNGGTMTIATRRAVFGADTVVDRTPIPAGRYAELSVEDTGEGMSADTLAHVFDPFFTTKEREKGTGLGLTMVFGIVKNHDGKVAIKSAPGEGTTVRLFFPEGGSTIPGTPVAEEPVPLPPPSGKGGTVLIVDDEFIIRDVVTAMLSSLGYETITANDGQEGVDAFRRNRDRIAVTILDLMMPVMDGRKAFEEIRKIDPDAKVIISSGYSGDEDVENLKAMGANAVMPKPYTLSNMEKILASLRG